MQKCLQLLPPFNPTLNQLLATLAKQDCSLYEIAELIEIDTVLAAHVLRVVNSPLYARLGTVSSVRHAIALLGLQKVRNIALGLSVNRFLSLVKAPKKWPAVEFNRHSVATAILCDLLASRTRVEYPEGAFTAGLLHGMGKLLIALTLQNNYDDLLVRAWRSGVPLHEFEIQTLGVSHADLCEIALREWNLPAPIQRAVGTQEEPPPQEGVIPLGRLLFEAHRAVNALGITIPACQSTLLLPPEDLLVDMGLGDKVPQLLAEFRTTFQQTEACY